MHRESNLLFYSMDHHIWLTWWVGDSQDLQGAKEDCLVAPCPQVHSHSPQCPSPSQLWCRLWCRGPLVDRPHLPILLSAPPPTIPLLMNTGKHNLLLDKEFWRRGGLRVCQWLIRYIMNSSDIYLLHKWYQICKWTMRNFTQCKD